MLSLIKLTASLKHYKSQYQAELASKKQLLLTAANDCPKGTNPENVSYCHAARRGEQTLAITLKEIVDALLWQNFSTLQQRNPFLTSEHCHQLMGLMIEYAVLQSAADQVDAAMTLINNREQFAAMEQYELQLLGRILSAKRHYSIQEYPEFLIYEYATKRIIRPDQSAALIQLISLIETNNINTNEFKHCLKQFAAGGGKSAVMIIILVARFVRRGFLPTIFNTNELYAIGVHEIAKNLRLAYNIDLEVIERELNFQWSSADLQRLTADLHIWHQGKEGKKALLVKPVTWHGIHIAQMLGSLNDDTDLLNEADKVLDFLFEYTIKLEDEGHIISDPLQSNITTRGELLGVGIQYQRLLLEIYSHLLGVQPQSRDLAELAGIIHKNKELLHDHELRRLQEQLSDRMIDFQAYKKIDATELRQFFLQETRTKPDWLKTLRQQQCELASLVVLGRAFIKSLLPHLLSLQYNNHFGTSIHAGDLTPAPMQDGKHLYSHFADLMLITALAIQLYDITGIPQHLLEEMITQYHQNHKKQRQSTQAAVTSAEQEFNRLLPKSVAYVHFEAFSTAKKQMLVNDFSIRHSYQFISEFLLQKVFPQITTPAMRIESTAADFQAGFQRSIIFTATPGLLETYPATLTVDYFYEMLSFEAEVVATLLKPENSQHCQFPMTHDPAVLFNSMYKQFPELFKKMTTLIDRGALVADIDPAAVTKIIFELFDERDARKSALFFEEGKMCFFSKSSTLNNTSYPGSDLLSVLKRHNIDAKQMLVFLFLDISKTTGTDVSRPQQDCAGLTIGKGQTLSSTIQAAMRERLLLEQNAQTVIWLIFIELYQKISPKSALFDLRIILKWMVKNDAEALTYKCINRAYQGINQAIKSLLKQYVHDGKKQLADLKPILRQLQSVDPYLIYELETLYAAPEKVLNDYIDEICKQCKLNREHDLPQHTLSRLKLIITQTHSLITIMSQPQGAELNALVCQEQVQAVKLQQLLQQSQTTQNILKIGNNIRFANEVYSLATDGLDNVFSSNSDYRQLSLELRNLSGNFTIPYLKIRHVHFHPYAHIKQSNALLFYKPIQVLLIAVIDNTKLDIVGCTATGIQFFEAQIKKIPPNHPHSYMLIGTEGHVLSASSNCTPDLKEKIVRNESVRDAVLFIALLNGRVNNVEDLVCFIKKYQWSAQDFDAFVNTVQTLHLSRSPVDLTNIPKLAQRCGWENQPESSPLAPEQTTARTAGVTLEQCTAPQRTPSQRCSALRFNIPPQSVLASCLFAKKANAFAQLTLPENTSQSNNKNQ